MENLLAGHEAKAKASMDYITDTLSGDEGGIPFIKFLSFVRIMADRADNGDEAAGQLLEMIYRFEKMIRLAQTTK